MKTSVVVAIVIGVAILAILGGGVAGYLIARSQVSASNIAWRIGVADRAMDVMDRRMMVPNMRNRMGSAMMGAWGWGGQIDQPRTQYMLDATAEALDLTSDELKDQLSSGKSIWDLASEKGVASADFDQFMIDAATSAINKMVADEVITQKQADTIIEQIQENWQNVDPETCPCIGEFGGRGRMRRWVTP